MSRTLRNLLGACGSLASVLWLGAGCSGDAHGGDGSADRSSGGAGGSASVIGSAGTAGAAGAAGNAASGGSSANAATYTAARACELFARATCGKATECGVVLAQTPLSLICVQCDAVSLSVIEQRCQQDAAGEKDAAAVDRCVASISAQPCMDACKNPNANDCDVFSQLAAASTTTLVCDPRCVQ